MSEERILQAISELSKNLNDKIDTVSQDLRDFKEETNTRLDKFEDETRTNFVSISHMIRNTNERIIEIDKKMEKRFEDNNRELGMLLNSAFESIDKIYVKKEKVV